MKTDQALKLQQLELNYLNLKNWPVPKVRSFPLSVCSPTAVPQSLNETGADVNLNSKRACFFCLEPNYLISDCRAWKQKVAASRPKSTALVYTLGDVANVTTVTSNSEYQWFLLDGTLSYSSESERK